MAIGNVIVLSQVSCFLLSFVLSFFVFVPVSINNGEFNGNCLLHATGVWHKTDPPVYELTDIKWGPESACNFSVFIGITVMVISICYTLWVSLYLFRGTDSSWLDAFVTAVVSFIIVVCLFSTAITITGGFSDWCTLITNKLSGMERCEDGEIKYRTRTPYLPPELGIDTSNYFSEFQIAQFGIWSLWMCWVVILSLSIIKIYRYHKQEAFLKSVSHQRQRLLQKVGHVSSYTENVSS